MAIPKRLKIKEPKQEILNKYGIEVELIKDHTAVIVKMIMVPEETIISKREFNQKFHMDYKTNLNHALKKDVKTDICEIICIKNKILQIDELCFDARVCKITHKIKTIKEMQDDPLDITLEVGFPCKLCPID